MTDQKIAVLGTGANGASIGADLTRAGLDVTLIEQWPAHVEAMRRHGIRVQLPEETITTPVTVINLCEVATLREKFDVVLVLMKAYDTTWATELIKPYVASDGLVVGVQNGMTVDDIARVVGVERTLGAVIEISSNMFEPGIVERQSPHARSWFAVGGIDPSTRGREHEAADLLRHSGTVEVTDDIRSSKWMKLVVNAAELVPSAILGLPLAEAVRVPGMREYMIEAGQEAVRTTLAIGNRVVPIFGMSADDVTSPEQFTEVLLDAVLNDYTLPSTRTTVLQDWMKGRRSEVDQINGLVVDEQRRMGGRAPANQIAVELAHRIESGELEASPANAALLTGH
ncbi:2-dehydropantoate 2-reductase [Glaciihabitans sp. INWT7]|uniref:ketopantoate reductase family protein n=1 Tax=Glaciihabitans sp. INWT7 TaxID=2596912 RepID=UPI0016231BD5|nr:2-dehydropantoate 2-reductase [Glaciihabitans sp. INWT7]QNE45820.1 2-dehydropantoate 2-reductase [Glaciihabitans sp. INWT7]